MELLPKDVQQIVYFYIHRYKLSSLLNDVSRLIRTDGRGHNLINDTCISCEYLRSSRKPYGEFLRYDETIRWTCHIKYATYRYDTFKTLK